MMIFWYKTLSEKCEYMHVCMHVRQHGLFIRRFQVWFPLKTVWYCCCCCLFPGQELYLTDLPMGTWGNSPPSCNINGHLVITWEVNTQLSLSCLAVWDCWWDCGWDLYSWDLQQVTSPAPGRFATQGLSVRDILLGIPVLVQWEAIAV